MTPLRQRFIDDLRPRNVSLQPVKAYIAGVVRFARLISRGPLQNWVPRRSALHRFVCLSNVPLGACEEIGPVSRRERSEDPGSASRTKQAESQVAPT